MVAGTAAPDVAPRAIGAPAAWAAERVAYRYPGAATLAVDDVSITVPTGRCTAILGPNGSGKSTLLSLLLGGVAAARGRVHFDGRPVDAWPRGELARRIGAVPQEEAASFPVTVRALVAMGRYPHLGAWQREGPADVAAVARALARCGLTELAERPVATLSGGERQRARLARALAQIAGPDGETPAGAALALDEPTAALDLAHEMAFFGLLRGLVRGGTTVLLVTHHLNLAARYADQLVLLDRGRVAAAGAPAAVLTPDVVSGVYGWPVRIVPHPGPGADAGAPQIVPLDPDG